MANEKKEYFFEYNMNFMLIIATVLTIVAVIVSVELLSLIHHGNNVFIEFFKDDFSFKVVIIYYIAFIAVFLWSVLHEIIHGVFYQLGGKKKKKITYGAALEKGIFYCRCGQYVNKKTIMMSLMAPFTIIGVITLIIGLIFNWTWLVLLSAVNIGGAGADLCMFFFFIKRKDDVQFMEYGDSTFFSLKTSENLDEKKFICVKAISKGKVPENDNKKRLVISKASWIISLLCIGLLALCLVLIYFV